MANAELAQLDLGHNSIEDAGAAAIGEALAPNTVEELYLGRNSIDSGAAAIGEALKGC